jgi:dethiobiotin synthetase
VRFVVVTGTGTGVGKTVAVAALASNLERAGQSVAVVKPYQTGVQPDEPGDLAMVARLAGITDLHEYVRYGEPLAPATAARRLGLEGLHPDEIAAKLLSFEDREVVIVEGAGGLLVQLTPSGSDLTSLINALGRQAEVAVLAVVSAGLGTLSATATTAIALRTRTGREFAGVIVGEWPTEPGLAERCNLADFDHYAQAPLVGVLPGRAAELDRAAFTQMAHQALTPAFGGAFDAPDFITRYAAPLPDQNPLPYQHRLPYQNRLPYQEPLPTQEGCL